MQNRKKLLAIALSTALFSSFTCSAETIRIGIGHQSKVTNTVTGGIILEKLKLVEKYLPTTGKYKDADYDIVYRDYDSGPPITNQMLASKLDFGVMGDYPLIVNGAKFQETGKDQSRFIAVTGYNLKGTGNAIVVPVDSPAQSIQDLAGKAISTPVGSAAWGMTLKVLDDAGLTDKVTLVNQSPPVGAANIAANKIDAHADFCPWSEIMEFRGTGRKIFDGSEANIPTFHGIVVRDAFAKKYPELVDAVLKATLDAQKWVENDPLNAAIKVSEWTGVEKEVLYLYFSNGGITTAEASIKPEWIDAMKYDHGLLQKQKSIPDLDFDSWVDDSYIRKAYAEMGIDYDAAVANVVSPKPGSPGLKPAEIWFADDGLVAYDSISEMLNAAETAKTQGKEIYSTYVYDNPTGLKLFGKMAYLVKGDDGKVVAFMKKSDSDQYIADNGGRLLNDQALLAMAD